MLLLFVALVQKKPAINTQQQQQMRLIPSNSTHPSSHSTPNAVVAHPTAPSSSSQNHKSEADREGTFNLMALGMMKEAMSSLRTVRSNPIAHRARVGYEANSIS